MAWAGLLGGELVVRNMISVDHRYADKGKWKEASVHGKPGEEVTVATADELHNGHMKLLWVNGERIALAKTEAGYCAFQDRCTHRGASLAAGVLVGDTVHCLWHGSQFNVRTGQVECGPAKEEIKLYKTRMKGNEVHLVIPPSDRPQGPGLRGLGPLRALRVTSSKPRQYNSRPIARSIGTGF